MPTLNASHVFAKELAMLSDQNVRAFVLAEILVDHGRAWGIDD